MAPQVIQVLLCVECKAFQGDIVKKAKKWECKICGTKQTILKVYGTGTGVECRNIVQKLNEGRGVLQVVNQNQNSNADNKEELKSLENSGQDSQDHEESESVTVETAPIASTNLEPSNSKWDVYVQESSKNQLY